MHNPGRNCDMWKMLASPGKCAKFAKSYMIHLSKGRIIPLLVRYLRTGSGTAHKVAALNGAHSRACHKEELCFLSRLSFCLSFTNTSIPWPFFGHPGLVLGLSLFK